MVLGGVRGKTDIGKVPAESDMGVEGFAGGITIMDGETGAAGVAVLGDVGGAGGKDRVRGGNRRLQP